MAEEKKLESEVVLNQFKRTLSHILIDAAAPGPEVTVGNVVLQFKQKAPVKALAALIGNENRVEGMIQYVRLTLVPGQEGDFEALLNDIDMEGLSEILNAVGEGYSSFPEKS